MIQKRVKTGPDENNEPLKSSINDDRPPGRYWTWGSFLQFSGSGPHPYSRRHALWELPQPRKSDKDAFGNFFLMISSAAWKSLRTKRSGFPTVPHSADDDDAFQKSTGK
jgi:hypothetical protein